MVYIFLADGFEIIEAMAPIDMLRRADVEIETVGVTGKTVLSSCGIPVVADTVIDEMNLENISAVIIPGGAVGVENLEACDKVKEAINYAVSNDLLICAICAGPSIFGHMGLLEGKNATAYPGFDKELIGAVLSDEYVAVDGNIITARGAGVSVEFGLEIAAKLAGRETADKIKAAIQCK